MNRTVDPDSTAVSRLAAQRFFLDPSRRRRARTFEFTQSEVDAATTLIHACEPVTMDLAQAPSVRDGLVRLLDRGLVRVEPGDPAMLPAAPRQGEPVHPVLVDWATVDAEAVALRHLARHFSHGPLVQSVVASRVDQHSQTAFTDAEVALVLAWQYRHSDVYGLDISHATNPVGPTTVEEVQALELRHHRDSIPFLIQAPPQGTRIVDVDAPHHFHDDGSTLPDDLFDQFVLLIASRYRSAKVDFDTLRVLPLRYQSGTWEQAMPALVQDALAYYQAPSLDSNEEFVAWAQNALVLTVPCGRVRHRLRVNPATHTTSPHPDTRVVVERHAAEHMLLALANPRLVDGRSPIGCQDANDALNAFGDSSQYAVQGWGPQQASMLAAARVLSRTAQYLAAGVDPKRARHFLRLGLRADQAADLLSQQTRDPDSVRALLTWWDKGGTPDSMKSTSDVTSPPNIPVVDGLDTDGCDLDQHMEPFGP